MKFIVFTKEQAESIKGKYGLYSAIEPVLIFRNKYLLGQKVPFTEVEEYILPLACLDDIDLQKINGFLKCFPVYDADYYQKVTDEETGKAQLIYLDRK